MSRLFNKDLRACYGNHWNPKIAASTIGGFVTEKLERVPRAVDESASAGPTRIAVRNGASKNKCAPAEIMAEHNSSLMIGTAKGSSATQWTIRPSTHAIDPCRNERSAC